MSNAALHDDLFAQPVKPVEYEIHYAPPDYPEKCFPSRCRHEGPFAMFAELHLCQAKGAGRQIEIDHAICFNCGLPQESTYGGNVLLTLTLIMQIQGPKHWKFAMHAQHLREKWTRIATYLFDEKGWNGRHERIARMIDRNLTMKLAIEGECGSVRIGRVSFDEEYLRPDVDE